MQTKTGIEVHVIRGDNGRIPLESKTDSETLVRVPHGPFKVRVASERTTEVKIELDGETALSTKVRSGSTDIDCDDDERPLIFGSEGVQADSRSGGDDALVTTEGRVVVSVRHTLPRLPRGEKPGPEEPWESVTFQMHTPGAGFNEAIAHNLDRIVSPVKDEGCPCGNFHFGDGPHNHGKRR
jgi:hypothetical protein